jgi:hypothetical protein
MPTHEQQHRTHAHLEPMGMDMGMGTQCRALLHIAMTNKWLILNPLDFKFQLTLHKIT